MSPSIYTPHTHAGSIFNPMITDLDNNDIFLMQSATIALTTPPDGSSEMLDLQSGVSAMLQQYNVSVSGGEL